MKEISPERLTRDARRVLESPFWIQDLQTGEFYARTHDDDDGTHEGKIRVAFSEDGDAWLSVEPTHNGAPLRFRNFLGGGMSLRVRNALMLLAWAIKLDNKERPQLP